MNRRKKLGFNGHTAFVVFNTIFMIFMIVITLYPFYYSVIASFSNPGKLMAHQGALLLPLKPYTGEAYQVIFDHPLVLSGFRNSFIVLFLGTFLNLVATSLGAYFLSLKNVLWKDLVAFMIVFTMYFGGGMIPTYLTVKELGLTNSLWSLMIPGLIGTYNMIILRTGFQAVPDSLKEAAILDGASHMQLLTQVILPLCKANLAVIMLYYAVGHWNAWFNASIYIRDNTLFPIQYVARNFMESPDLMGGAGSEAARYQELLKYALIIVVSSPIVILYPFLQKYFAKGVMIGALKG